ncbi:Outer membrane protein beta-barrel domain protein [compost metagenome]
MKKITLVILFLLFSIQSFAQLQDSLLYGFRLGITAHPNFGFMRAADGNSNGATLGFTYGLIGDFNFAERLSFSTGLTISSINGKTTERNANFPESDPTAIYDLKYMMRYIEIPISVKFKTDKIGKLKWYGQLGLSNDFKIRARQDIRMGNKLIADQINSGAWTRFYRVGWILGGGLEYDVIDHTSLLLGLSLNKGFTNISTGKSKVKNNTVGIHLGLLF